MASRAYGRLAAPGQTLPATDDGHIDAHEFLRVIWRHKYIVIGAIAVACTAVLLYLANAPRLYTASTSIEVKTGASQGDGKMAVGPMTQQDEVRIATHMALLRSPTLAQEVIKDLDLDTDPEFADPALRDLLPDDPAEAEATWLASVTDSLLEHVEIARTGQSALISISVTTTDPEKSAAIANALAGTHRKNLVREQKSATKRQIEAAEDRAGALRREALEGERMAVDRGKTSGTTGALDGGGAFSTAGLSAQLSEAKAARAAAETRFSQLGRIGGGVSGPGSSASPLLADLRSQEALLEKRIAELSAQYGPGHPDLRAALAQRQEISERLSQEMARVRQEAAAEVAAARARESQIAADLGAAQGRLERAADASVAVSDLQHSASTNRQLYLSQLARLQELRGEENSLRPDASIVVKALVPVEPASPKPARLMAVALIGGLLVGVLLAFAVDILDRRVRTSGQVARLTGHRTLAMVPEVQGAGADLDPVAYLADEPSSPFSEAIRSLMLDVVGYVKGVGRVVLISSALPREGKTLLSVSLAVAAAMSGRRSIIVDFDLRRPAVAPMLHVETGSPDLLECLTTTGVLDGDMVAAATRAHPTLDKLSLLAPASLAQDAGMILSSDRVADLVRILRKRYDVVVLNAPPILPVRDAKHLARLSDACLLVARWGRTSSDALRSANDLLGRSVSGVVINRVNLKRHADSRYGDSIQHYEAYAGYFGKPR